MSRRKRTMVNVDGFITPVPAKPRKTKTTIAPPVFLGKRTKRTVKVSAQNVRRYQQLSKLSYREIATKFGIGYSTLVKWMASDAVSPAVDQLAQVEIVRITTTSSPMVSVMLQIPKHKLDLITAYLDFHGVKYVTQA